MSDIDALMADHPWPETKPNAPTKHWGWGIDGQELLLAHIPADATTIVEIGSLLGGSARFFAEHFAKARLLCVDPWLDVKDIRDRPFLAHNPELTDYVTKEKDGLYQVFLASNWDLRHRLTAIRGFSPEMLAPIHEAGVQPTAIYIDGSHVYEDVLADLLVAMTLFPKAIICGDDWDWPGVQQGINYVAVSRGVRILTSGNTWLLDQGEPSGRQPAISTVTVGPVEHSLPVRLAKALLQRGRKLLDR